MQTQTTPPQTHTLTLCLLITNCPSVWRGCRVEWRSLRTPGRIHLGKQIAFSTVKFSQQHEVGKQECIINCIRFGKMRVMFAPNSSGAWVGATYLPLYLPRQATLEKLWSMWWGMIRFLSICMNQRLIHAHSNTHTFSTLGNVKLLLATQKEGRTYGWRTDNWQGRECWDAGVDGLLPGTTLKI